MPAMPQWHCTEGVGGQDVALTAACFARTAQPVIGEASHLALRLPQHTLNTQISTGLDSATTHAIVSSLRSISRSLQVTQLLALLQPPPETAALFDDVMVGC